MAGCGKNRYNLTSYEKETIISFNDGDSVGTVYTCNAKFIRKMDMLMKQYPDVIGLKNEDEASRTYNIPKKLISIRVPREKKGLALAKIPNWH